MQASSKPTGEEVKRGRGRPPGSLNRNNEAYLMAKYANTYASQEAVNVDTVRALVERCASDKRCPNDAEKSSLNTFKEWAPKRDLLAVLESLHNKKHLLVLALQSCEPGYEPPPVAPPEEFRRPAPAEQEAKEEEVPAPPGGKKRKAAQDDPPHLSD